MRIAIPRLPWRKYALVGACFVARAVAGLAQTSHAAGPNTEIRSPDGRNTIALNVTGGCVSLRVLRGDRLLFGPSPLGLVLIDGGQLDRGNRLVDVQHREVDEAFELPWGKTKQVSNRCSRATVTLENASNLRWQVELCAYDDGVAFRYRLLQHRGLKEFALQAEATQFDPVGDPVAIFNTLDSFTSSHESLYERAPLTTLPTGKLLDCPLLLLWPDGPAAAITEARVRAYAGMYLERESAQETSLQCRLSPLPSRDGVCVVGKM